MEDKMNKRRKYDRDFKRNTVLLCAEPGRTVTEVAENLGIAKNLLIAMERDILRKAMAIFSRAPK
jgi:transposase-like protein